MRNRTPEILLLALALLLRLGWASTASTELWFDHVFNDATAVSIAEGRGFTVSLETPYDPAVFRTPGYSVFLAAVYSVAGHSVRAAFVAQALLDVLSCFLLYLLVLHRFGRGAARWVLLFAATYPFTIYSTGRLSAETLLVFLGLALTGLLDRAGPEGKGRWLAIGALAGVLAWVKPVFLPLPAMLFVLELVRRRGFTTALTRAALAGVVMAVVFAPWVIRNYRAFDGFVLAAEIGLVVWHGTFDFEEQRDEMVESRFSGEAPAETDRYQATRMRFADSKALLEQDALFLEKGLARIRERPTRAFLTDPLRRVPRLWVSTTFMGGPALIGLGAAAGCVAYLLFAAAGLFLTRHRARELAAWWVLPVLLTTVYAAIHVEARYTLPARSTLLLFAGITLHHLAGRWLGRARES